MAVNTHSISLNGSSQYLTAADSASLSITGDISCEAWIKIDINNNYQTIIGKYEDTKFSYVFGIWNDGKLYFAYSQDGTDGTNRTRANGSTVLSTGTWYHVAVAVDVSEKTMTFYLNGVAETTTYVTQGSTSIHDNNALVGVGALTYTPGDYKLDGLIDEVRVWNVIRTTTEINANKSKRIVSYPGLVASWSLDNTLTDSSGNGNTLTNVGSATFSTDVSALTSVITTEDKYSETNVDVYAEVYNTVQYSGQAFQTLNDGLTYKLISSNFFIKKVGSPTGNITAQLFAHSGTYGSSSVATGSALAISDTIDITSISTTASLVQFNFSGANQYSLVANTNYVILLNFEGGNSSGNNISLGGDGSSPSHAGIGVYYESSAFHTSSRDYSFYVIGEYTPSSGSTAKSIISDFILFN